MSDTDGYNGWTNRATWAVALHVNNDQGWQEQVHDIVQEEIALMGNADDVDVYGIADLIKDNVTTLVDPGAYLAEFGDAPLSQWVNGPGLAARDIGDLGEVNWYELAESFIRDVRDQNA